MATSATSASATRGAASFAATAYGKLTGELGRLLRDRRSGFDQPPHRALRREDGPGAGARPVRAGPERRSGAEGRLPGHGPRRGVCRRGPLFGRPSRRDPTTPRSCRWPASTATGRARRRPVGLPGRGPGTPGAGSAPGPARPHGRTGNRAIAPPPEDALAAAVSRPIDAAAERPVVDRRQRGARGDGRRSSRWRRSSTAPVLTTFKGKGLISDASSARGWRARAVSGTPVASWFMNESGPVDHLRRVVREPHRDLVTTSRSCRSTSIRWRWGGSTRSTMPVQGHVGVTARRHAGRVPLRPTADA